MLVHTRCAGKKMSAYHTVKINYVFALEMQSRESQARELDVYMAEAWCPWYLKGVHYCEVCPRSDRVVWILFNYFMSSKYAMFTNHICPLFVKPETHVIPTGCTAASVLWLSGCWLLEFGTLPACPNCYQTVLLVLQTAPPLCDWPSVQEKSLLHPPSTQTPEIQYVQWHSVTIALHVHRCSAHICG